MLWTKQQTERLRQLVKKNIPAGQIAADLKVFTRNAVIGKIYRLGLSKPRPPPRDKDSSGAVKSLSEGILRQKKPLLKKQLLTVLDLTDKTCKWPIGEPGTVAFHFCGATPVSGFPYCDKHVANAYSVQHNRGRSNIKVKRARAPEQAEPAKPVELMSPPVKR